MVACDFKLVDGKILVVNLGFLHAKDVRAICFKPRHNNVETGSNGIHIVGGYSEDSHGIYKDKLYWSNDYKENPFNCQYETGSMYIGAARYWLFLR
jgi:hypothetical protein